MKKNPGLIFTLSLMVGDAIAIVFSFLFAYLVRTHIDPRPYYFAAEPLAFAGTILFLIPIWWIILGLVGAYNKPILASRSRFPELGRLFAASVIGVMVLIAYDFFYQHDLFPVRAVALWAVILCFVFLSLIRILLRFLRVRRAARTHAGLLRTIIIGDSKNTERLLQHLFAFPEDGYKVVAIVAKNHFVPKEFQKYRHSSLKDALASVEADAIFQTDEAQTEYIYNQAVKHHQLYYFVPTEADLSSHSGSLELIGNTPAILVRVTPLMGGARIIKRAMDLIIGGLAFIIALIPMIVIWCALKITDPKHSAFYADTRLSRYDKKVRIYKFRSMKPEYSGLTPEEAFTKMGKCDIIEEYRANGDFLSDDPRITKFGQFLRSTSLDELPQLFNVLRGDISLVGPRALVPGELRDYGDRSLLLSVKSGLTGLAQVSGRRDISFEERRALDIYYIQNWSISLDLQILARTITSVIAQKGAK